MIVKSLRDKVPTLRCLSREEYRIFSAEIVRMLSKSFGVYSGSLITIPSYAYKESYENVRLIICNSRLPSNFATTIQNNFKPKATYQDENCMVYSFEYNDVQIDLFHVSDEKYSFAANYFSYDNICNLISILAEKMGFKLRYDGLHVPVYYNNEKIKYVLVTGSFSETLELLGFGTGYNYYFTSELDLYRFIVNSKYFNKDIFLPENRSDIEKQEDQRIPIYGNFINYIRPNNIMNKFNYSDPIKKPWVEQLKKNYPLVIKDCISIIDNRKRQDLIKYKFNNDIVTQITGIGIDEKLNKFLKDFKASFKSNYDFEQFVLTSSPETIKSISKSFFDNWTYVGIPKLEPISRKKKKIKELESLPISTVEVGQGIIAST
jgi:hypothetical protein